MANLMPEVKPVVTSMPTTGWFLQTSGSARKRVSQNKGTSVRGIFDVTGVPGHTHNASAVISVDADYTQYRENAIAIGAGVWAADALLPMPIGLLRDSVEPDNADERYDRAIERCVGYISLRPENCANFIREPTRSIGEVRTLVAPKARLDTLTYVEELAGWRVPDSAAFPPGAAGPNTGDRPALVSEFPDIHLQVGPISCPGTPTRTKRAAWFALATWRPRGSGTECTR